MNLDVRIYSEKIEDNLVSFHYEDNITGESGKLSIQIEDEVKTGTNELGIDVQNEIMIAVAKQLLLEIFISKGLVKK